jgi:3-hydroxy-9,10-secoandrosta-1,3,5(10)-triene-9,17-dione monooxygenase
MFIRVVTTPAIGAAKHALKLFTTGAGNSSTDPTKLRDDPDIARRVAETANDIDEVETILFRNFEKMLAAIESGQAISLADRAHYRYQASIVIDRMAQAVQRLFEVAGGRSVFNGAQIQNIWRDINVARAHVANNPTPFARNLGTMLLGGDNSDFFI